jgi:hypothetical protein
MEQRAPVSVTPRFAINFYHDATYNLVSHYVPDIKHVIYDPATDRFLDTRTGREYTEGRFRVLAATRGARQADAGVATLKRAAIANSGLSESLTETEWRALLAALVSRRPVAAYQLKGIFSRTAEARRPGGLSVSAVQNTVAPVLARWKFCPGIRVVRYADQMP